MNREFMENLMRSGRERQPREFLGAQGDWENQSEIWMKRFSAAEAILTESGLDGCKIDEVALMVDTIEDEYMILESAVRNGFEMRNAAIDEVVTKPIPSDYTVHYSFLFHESLPFRIEVMRLMDGVSPLHNAVLEASRCGNCYTLHNPVEMHYSFKVGSEQDFLDAELLLEGSGLEKAQGCRSTYGVFSYWVQNPDRGEAVGTFLKPRANLRDGQGEGA